MAQRTHFPLTVFFDGKCSVCSREMRIYQQRKCDGRLTFIDISAPGFIAADHGRSAEEFMRELHVRDADGNFYTGVEAFVRIWSAFPESPLYSLLGHTVSLPGIRQGADLGYATFARLRHLLPRTGCHDGSCELH